MLHVLVSYYTDRSGASILGIYEQEAEVADRLAAINASSPSRMVKVIHMPLNRINEHSIFEED